MDMSFLYLLAMLALAIIAPPLDKQIRQAVRGVNALSTKYVTHVSKYWERRYDSPLNIGIVLPSGPVAKPVGTAVSGALQCTALTMLLKDLPRAARA